MYLLLNHQKIKNFRNPNIFSMCVFYKITQSSVNASNFTTGSSACSQLNIHLLCSQSILWLVTVLTINLMTHSPACNLFNDWWLCLQSYLLSMAGLATAFDCI